MLRVHATTVNRVDWERSRRVYYFSDQWLKFQNYKSKQRLHDWTRAMTPDMHNSFVELFLMIYDVLENNDNPQWRNVSHNMVWRDIDLADNS